MDWEVDASAVASIDGPLLWDTVVCGAQVFEHGRATTHRFAPEGRRTRSPRVLLRDLTRQAHLDLPT
ncbi:MAG: hypothetical protein ACI9VR_004238 [Cognaticolwellia sp.]